MMSNRFQKPISILDILDTLGDFTGKTLVSKMLKPGHLEKFGHLGSLDILEVFRPKPRANLDDHVEHHAR